MALSRTGTVSKMGLTGQLGARGVIGLGARLSSGEGRTQEIIRHVHTIYQALRRLEHITSHAPQDYPEQVVTQWLGDPAYRDKAGSPIPLPQEARGASLGKLIRKILPGRDVREIVAHLLNTGVIREVPLAEGRSRRREPLYEPVRRFASYRHDISGYLEITAHNIRQHLDTVVYNLGCATDRDTRIDRTALNRHIPLREAAKVQQFLKKEGERLLNRVDAYLYRRAVTPGTQPTMAVGATFCALQEPSIQTWPKGTQRTQQRPTAPRRSARS